MDWTPVEYYYGETLRWSFGFENPNKAAVLFACVLPLLWGMWHLSWRCRSVWKRVISATLCAAGILATGFCLTMTFSRGGLVAAGVAMVYLCTGLWRTKTLPQAKGMVASSIVLSVILAAMPVVSGLGHRSLEAVGGEDASVGNRFILWKGALQMAWENPVGFGAGNSGREYMQWYQPIEMTAGYRTMVNSYLTFLVERGWLRSLAVSVLAILFWSWTRPGERDRGSHRGTATHGGCRGHVITLILRSGIVAFLVAGVFSSVMEEPRLWILPGMCVVVLAGGHIRNRTKMAWRHVAKLAIALAVSGLVLAAGSRHYSGEDPLEKNFDGQGKISRIGQKREPARFTLAVKHDEEVIGPLFGKELRRLANAGLELHLSDGSFCKDRLTMGREVEGNGSQWTADHLFLLAPTKMDPVQADAVLRRARHVFLIVPSLDEDGRVSFWRERAQNCTLSQMSLLKIDGAGIMMASVFDEIINAITSGLADGRWPMKSLEEESVEDNPPSLPEILNPASQKSPTNGKPAKPTSPTTKTNQQNTSQLTKPTKPLFFS